MVLELMFFNMTKVTNKQTNRLDYHGFIPNLVAYEFQTNSGYKKYKK